jgi:hypothetical protein
METFALETSFRINIHCIFRRAPFFGSRDPRGTSEKIFGEEQPGGT